MHLAVTGMPFSPVCEDSPPFLGYSPECVCFAVQNGLVQHDWTYHRRRALVAFSVAFRMLGALVCHVSCKLVIQRCSIRYQEGCRENGFGAASWQRIVDSGLISSLQMLLALALLAANRARAAASKQLCMTISTCQQAPVMVWRG